MIDTLTIFEELSQAMEPQAARKLASVLGLMYQDLQNTVTKSDFNELKAIVRDLAEAQKRTEARLDSLTQRVEELAEAQKRTEARVEELAEAQKRTEVSVKELAEGLKQTRIDLGGLTHTVGYTLENEAYRALPHLLKRDYAIELTGRLVRRHLPLKAGGTLEVNILGPAQRQGRPVHVVGEAKGQLHRRDVREFLDRQLPRLQAELGEVFPVLVTHMMPEPGLEEFIRQQSIALYYSYDFAGSQQF